MYYNKLFYFLTNHLIIKQYLSQQKIRKKSVAWIEMSYNQNKKDYHKNFRRNNNYENYNKEYHNYSSFHSERQRSRDLYNQQNKSSQQHHTVYNKKKDYSQLTNSFKVNKEYQGFDKVVRQANVMDIGSPKVYLLWKHSKISSQSLAPSKNMKFQLDFNVNSKPPLKTQAQSSRLSQLKNSITPVEQIWSQIIKQYLNDSQFVEIYRKKNSLSYGQIQYGKTIINYDGLQQQQKKFYDNTQTQYNIFSRAYFKLWEILSLGILNNKRQQDITIANLAQGPGGFIHGLIDFRLKQNKALQDRYYAITLKIEQGKTRNAKDWSDYRGSQFFEKIKHEGYKVKLSYGQTGDGNLYDVKNIESFKTHQMQGKQAFLVTGDGGIQCIGDDEFHYQQIFNAKLFFSEILTALRIQEIGGVFILKIYDIHFEITKQLLMLLCMYYRKVGIIKPLTSRPGNSQKYVLCEGYLGVQAQQLERLTQILVKWHKTEQCLSYFQNKEYVQSILKFKDLSQISGGFEQTILQRISIINKHLSSEQQVKIEQGLQIIKRHGGQKQQIKKEIRQKRYNYQLNYAYSWCKKYGLKHIDIKDVNEKGN